MVINILYIEPWPNLAAVYQPSFQKRINCLVDIVSNVNDAILKLASNDYDVIIAEPVSYSRESSSDITKLILELQSSRCPPIMINSVESLGTLQQEYGLKLRPQDSYRQKGTDIEEFNRALSNIVQYFPPI